MRELLVVIAYQNDFVTGALGNPAAAALEPGIAARVAAQLERGGRVLFTRDTHGTDYLNTREGRFLPVAHCIKGSQGWGLYGFVMSYKHTGAVRYLAAAQKIAEYVLSRLPENGQMPEIPKLRQRGIVSRSRSLRSFWCQGAS